MINETKNYVSNCLLFFRPSTQAVHLENIANVLLCRVHNIF